MKAQAPLTQMAAVAELEAGLIGERTKNALAAARKRIVRTGQRGRPDIKRLGNPNGARALKGKQVGNAEAVAKLKATAAQRAADLRAHRGRHQVLWYHERSRHRRRATRTRHQGSSGTHLASYGRLAAAEPALTVEASTRALIGRLVAARETAGLIWVPFRSTYGSQMADIPGFKIGGFAGHRLRAKTSSALRWL